MSEFDAIIKSTPGLGQMAMATRMVEAVSSGKMSEWRFGCFQQELAKALHPEARSLGEAIAKTMDSEIGRIVWGPRRAVTTERNRELMKRESGERVPHVHAAQAQGVDDDDDDDNSAARRIDGIVLQLMRSNPGMSKDEAHRRAEQMPGVQALLSRAHAAAVRKNASG
jgi:hypothetical protein